VARFHIRFDFHDLPPFLISDTNAYFLWPALTFVLIFMMVSPFMNRDSRYLAVLLPCEKLSTESGEAGVAED